MPEFDQLIGDYQARHVRGQPIQRKARSED
jgi:hypothetical protein